LNLWPLPCQIPRGFASLYVGRVETGKDHQKAAGERRCQCPSYPMIRHGFPRFLLVPTVAGCCPSAARRTKPDPRDHNPNPSTASSQLHDLAPGDLWFLRTVGHRWRAQLDDPLPVTVADRCIPLVPAACGTRVARPARTTMLPHLAAMAPGLLAGPAHPERPGNDL
jgi:hypothetical protein